MTVPSDEMKALGSVPDPFASHDVDALPPPPALPSGAGTRSEHARRLGFSIVLAIGWQAFWTLAIEHRSDLGAPSMGAIALGLLVPLVAMGLAAWAGLARGERGLGLPVTLLASLIVASALFFAAATLGVDPADHAPSAGAFVDRAARCALVTSLLCVPSLALVVRAFRAAFVTMATWRTAALGVACGALSAATMSLVCPHGEALHVLVGHGIMMLVGGIVGALLGARWTRA